MTAPLGPIQSDIRRVGDSLETLWRQVSIEMRAYTGSLVVLTEKKHLERILDALTELRGRYVGRQIIVLLDGESDLQVLTSLFPQIGGLYVERLLVGAAPEQVLGALAALLPPETVSHVWWASDQAPAEALLAELTDLADQLILDSLTLGIQPIQHCTLADLNWSRCASWREAVAQIFDQGDAAKQLARITKLHIVYSGNRDFAARLFAGFIAHTLGWKNLQKVTFESAQCQRELGDLCGLAMLGEGVEFKLTALEDERVAVEMTWDQMNRKTEMNVPTLTLARGLVYVLVQSRQNVVFEQALSLARKC